MADVTIRKIDDDAIEILQYAAAHDHRTLTAFLRLEIEKLAARIDRRVSKINEASDEAAATTEA